MSEYYFQTRNLSVGYNGRALIRDINIGVRRGEIVSLIGPNGAGKSTMFKSISGFNKIDSGTIRFKDRDITKLGPVEVCRAGIACTFQKAQSFAGMTLEESVLVGAYLRRKRKKDALPFAHEMIRFVGLEGKEQVKIPRLNMFERKKAELAAALATEPEMLLLDELFAGLVPTEVEMMLELVKKVNGELGIALFIVEHVLRVIMSLCEKVYVLEYGEIIASGSPQVISSDERVIKAYLGEDYDVADDQ